MSGAVPETFAAVVVPTYNHGPAVGAVLDGLAPLGLPVIVVDDGSTDGTDAALDAWQAANPAAGLVRLRHGHNRGKAAALRTGFQAAAAIPGVTHAATIDSDGQLDPGDVPLLLAEARKDPRALIIGVRPAVMPGCPRRCEVGRAFAGLAVRAQTGRRLGDTQCGLRVYPLDLVRDGRARSGRYAFEAEVITRAVWDGRGVVEVPVRCTYRVGAARVSHFRPVVDSLRQLGVHTRLILAALLPWTGSRAGPKRESRRPACVGEAGRRLLGWLNPARCIREARATGAGGLELAAALAVGAWIGTVPFYGFHTAMCLYVAWRLNLHPAATVVGSQVALPPLGIAVSAASVWVGHLLLTGRALVPADAAAAWSDLPRAAWELFPAWTVGGFIVGFALGLAVFAATLLVVSPFRAGSPARS